MVIKRKIILGGSLVFLSFLLMVLVIGAGLPASASPLLGLTPTPDVLQPTATPMQPTATPMQPTATPAPVISTPEPQVPTPTLTATPVPILPISGAARPSGAPFFAIMFLSVLVFGALAVFRRKVRQ